jgi:hypothetical protein
VQQRKVTSKTEYMTIQNIRAIGRLLYHYLAM